ncbi:MAG TPA: decarboxylating 6-phosphogluconate dehydrogenase [Terriglobia bacterium]|nr:decarboxylating 6-phosphogluconate dehydrogenase [Terriglobia bacterium]
MELGLIGLGRMGANMTERLLKGGHRVVVHDIDRRAIDRAIANGAAGAASIEDLVKALKAPRTVWLMVPSGEPVEKTLDALLPLLDKGDVVIDGGNSNYKDTIRRAARLADRSIEFVDVGTSGGIWGLTQGYCLMIGGAPAIVGHLRPVFETLAPAKDRGWAHVGPVGAGHFVKMVHNGIEYGLMQAYAEGFAVMNKKTDFQLDLQQIAETWRHGSVVRSWLLDLTAEALQENPRLEGIQPYVADSGEGRWTVAEAIDLNISAPVITLSLLERLRSRDEEAFGTKLLALMRNKFGGHALKKKQ